MMIYERQQANEMGLTVAPAYCLEGICRPWHKEGEPLWNMGVGRPRPLKFAGQGNRGESHPEDWRPAGIPVTYSSEYWSVHMY